MLQGLKVSSSMLSSWAAMRPRKRPLGKYGGLNLRQWLATWGLLCNGRVNPTPIHAWLCLQPEISGGRGHMVRASSQLHAARDRLADARDRFLAGEPGVVWAVSSGERRCGPHRAELPARPRPGDHAGPDGRSGAAAPARAA